MHYLALFYGSRDLTITGTIGQRKADKILDEMLGSIGSPIFNDELLARRKEVESGLTKLLGPLQLKSEFQGNFINVEIQDIASDFAANFNYLLRFINSAAGFLLIVAYETTKETLSEEKRNNHLWQFLRHCRNACAHNGLFYFKKDEPKLPAQWGHLKIEKHLQGTRLLNEIEKKGMLSPGDPIRLLWDIEQELL